MAVATPPYANNLPRNRNGEHRPDPDPTTLTTQQLDKAVSSLREVIEARLIGSDKAVELLQAATNKIPEHITASVLRLQELHEEKFDSISIQFAERDKRTEQLSLANDKAITAALQAQKESAGSTTEMVNAAMAKMETNFTKLIDQSQQAQSAQAQSMDDKINLLNSRLDKGEGTYRGASNQQERTSGTIGLVIAGIIAFTVLMTGLAGLIAFVVTRPAAVNSYPAPWSSTPPSR